MTKLSNLTKVTTVGDDALFYIVDPARSAGDRSVGMDKDDVQTLVGGGGGAVVSKTGNTMVFTESAIYNASTYLTSGDIAIDGTNAKLGVAVWQHCFGYVPNIVTPNNEKYRISGNTPTSTKLNIYKIVFNGDKFDVIVDTKSVLNTPSPELLSLDTQITIRNFEVINAKNYVIKANTVNDENTATIIYSGNGLDLTPNYEYNYTGLANDVPYFFFISCTGNGFEDSLTFTGSATPNNGVLYNVYLGGVGATLTNATEFAAKFDGITDANVLVYIVDANNNVYAGLDAQATRTIVEAFNSDPALRDGLTYFIDLDGFLQETNQFDFQGGGTLSNLKMWYSPSAILRGTTSASRNFRNRTVNFELIYAPADPQIGNSATADNQVFDLLTTGIEIFVNSGAETINAGSPDLDITNAITQRSAVVTYVTDTVSIPNAVSDLSGNNITSNSVDLTFTTPSSTNPILKYEVWVNGAFYDWVNASGGTVSGLTSGTTYNVEIKTADNQYNLSELSNTYNFTTL